MAGRGIERRSFLGMGICCSINLATSSSQAKRAHALASEGGGPTPIGRPIAAVRQLRWWQSGLIYQIYPLSFQDSDGNGLGDLPGIISRVDYLSWLGVKAVWISPMYPSPMIDLGYDVSDFCDVDPRFGSLADLDDLTSKLHERGIKLILDFVANHTSASHPWFVESRSSRSNAKRDWYIWVDPAHDGGVPNNWLSRFGGSGWEFDATTVQYYYHSFFKEQPDLNWRNPAVRAAMTDVLRFWLSRGIDGFRIDSAGVLIEDALLRDDPPNPKFRENSPPAERFKRVYTDSQPETLDCLAELREVEEEFPDRVLLGEVDIAGDRLADFYGRKTPCLNLPLNYGLRKANWSDPATLVQIVEDYLGRVPVSEWPCWATGCHDMSRFATRAGKSHVRLAAVLLVTLPGTTILYAGDEIGANDVMDSTQQPRDELERRNPGYDLNRDPHRSPMCWDSAANAGFTSGRPWLPLEPSCLSVETEQRDERSLLHLYRSLFALRNMEPAIQCGAYATLSADARTLVFGRYLGEQAIVVSLNFSESFVHSVSPREGVIMLSTHLDRVGEPTPGMTALRPYEGVVIRLSPEKSRSEAIAQ
jgi:alpha-glucosidase